MGIENRLAKGEGQPALGEAEGARQGAQGESPRRPDVCALKANTGTGHLVSCHNV